MFPFLSCSSLTELTISFSSGIHRALSIFNLFYKRNYLMTEEGSVEMEIDRWIEEERERKSGGCELCLYLQLHVWSQEACHTGSGG